MKKNCSLYFGLIVFLFGFQNTHGQQLHDLTTNELIARQYISVSHCEQFETLQIQDLQGRIKPVHTLALELLRKIHGKSKFTYFDSQEKKKQLSAIQVFLGMHLKPDSWQLLPIIKIEKTAIPALRERIEINEEGYAKPSQFFDFLGHYKLQKEVANAYAKMNHKRDVHDKNIIKIDERINILWGIFDKRFLKIFPEASAENQKWYCPTDKTNFFAESDLLVFNKIIPTYLSQLQLGVDSNNWTRANETVSMLKGFQKRNAGKLLLTNESVVWEIFYNKKNIFLWCMMGYAVVGFLLLVFSFVKVFKPNKKLNYAIKCCLVFLGCILLYHFFGVGLRWYVSGHAPWSNGYEATIFIAAITVLAGCIFSKKNAFPGAGASLIGVCLLGIAHGSLMSPEVTNLVPVLKSYWLIIHVAIITGSYGFLTLGSLLALIAIIFMTIATLNNRSQMRSVILELTQINEKTTTIGLFMLTIGTFLGGIWANESWGRYWGWDPKETWALISIIIYAFVLHIKMIFKGKFLYYYNVFSLFALASLIMTFFGVNYYLSGLHSYAKGDSFPIPKWIPITIPILVFLAVIAKYRYRNIENIKLES